MANQFSVERPTVTAAVGGVATAHEEIDGYLTRLRGQLSSVLSDSAVWRGDAQASFVGVHERVDAATRKINSALADIGQQLRLSDALYGETDSDSSTVIGRSAAGI